MRRVPRFGLPVLLVAAGVASLGAQTSRVPASVAHRVAALVAARWQVPDSTVRLAWDSVGAAPALDAAGLQLIVQRGGWFTAAIPAAHGPSVIRWRVRAGVEQRVLVAAAPLPGNTVLTAAIARDTMLVDWGRPVARRPARFGWVTRRRVAAGEILAVPVAEPAPVIAAGDSVELVWARGRIHLVVHGIAAQRAAAVGDRIAVRLSGGRTLAGTVTGPGRVAVIHQ